MKLYNFSFLLTFTFLLGQASLIVNTSSGADEYLIESIAYLNFNDSSDSLFIYTSGPTHTYSILNIESLKFSGELSMSDIQQLTSFSLNQNYPNPFNPVTVISFDVVKMDEISLIVYDLSGKEVITLVSGTFMPGSYLVNWSAVNNYGDAIVSGMYVYRYINSEKVITKKMLYLK